MASSWQYNKSLSESNEYMFNNEILSDVIFLAGPTKTPIKVHKYLLVSRSPVFFAMFCGELAEASQPIEIPDVDAGSMKELLRYIYTGVCPINGNNVLYLLYGAKKYDIPALEQECKSFIHENLFSTNVFVIFQQAREFDDKELADRCMEFIMKNASKALKSDGFKTVSKDTVIKVISNDNFSITDETEIYEACKTWAEAQCRELDKDVTPTGIRDVLGDVIQHIRFPLMTAESFTKHVSNDKILSDKELVAIYQYITMGGEIAQFCVKEREYCLDALRTVTIERFPGCELRPFDWFDSASELCISLSKNALLTGLSIFQPVYENMFIVHLKVLEHEKTLVDEHVKINYNGALYEDIFFEKPITLKRGIKYVLYQYAEGLSTFCGSDGPEFVEKDGIMVTFTDSKSSENNTTKTYGQFARLLLRYK